MKRIRIPRWIWYLSGLLLIVVIPALILPVENKVITSQVRENAPGDFARLSDGYTHYYLEGDSRSPAVVLVHGFSVPSYVWDPTVESLLDSGFRVLRYDLYGRGYSDRPDLKYDQELFVKQLSEIIDFLEIRKPVHLVGLSMGGPIIARYANQNPGQVSSVTLIAPESVDTKPGDILPMNIPLVGEYFMQVILEPILLPRLQANDFYQPDLFPGWEERYREQLQFKGTGRALLSTIRALVEIHPLQQYQDLSQNAIPIQVIWGTEDQTISGSDIQQVLNMLPESKYVEVPLAGHLPHYERPELVSKELIDFLKEVQNLSDQDRD